MRYKKTIAATLILGLVIGAGMYYRSQLVHWIVQDYFAKKGIKIEFSINHFSFSGIALSDIVIDDTIKIDSLDVSVSDFRPSLMQVTAIQLKMGELDPAEVSKVSAKLLGMSPSAPTGGAGGATGTASDKPIDFAYLAGLCSQVQPMELDIEVATLIYQNLAVPLNLKAKKDQNGSTLQVDLHGTLQTSPVPESFQWQQMDYLADLQVHCGAEEINLNFPKLTTKIQHGKNTAGDILAPHAELILNDATVEVSSSGELNILLPGTIDFEIDAFKNVYKAKKSAVKWQVQSKLAEFLPIKGSLALDAIDLKTSFFVAEGLKLHGTYEVSTDKYTSRLSISDRHKILHLRSADISYAPKGQTIVIQFAPGKNHLEINAHVAQMFPQLKEYEVTGEGKIFVSGPVRSKDDKWVGKVALVGKKINLNSKSGYVKNLNFSHDVLEYPKLASSTVRTFTADEIGSGQFINDVVLSYHINDLSRINIARLAFRYDDATVEAKAFMIDATHIRLHGFDADVKNLSLEKLLQLPLGDTITAKGRLYGNISIEVLKRIPTVKGFLKTMEKGWIRYRQQAFNPTLSLNTTPMDILEGYLYDFEYDDLEVEIASDAVYDMDMTLRVFGRNPSYVQGKPLKLNVNVEQNLLAAFKAMMLTYSTEQKIEKQFESMGTKK